jgi:alginate O-acetyltransferase complex protein AlgI
VSPSPPASLNGFYQWAAVATRPLWRNVGKSLPRLSRSAPLTVLRVVLTFHLIAVTRVFFRAKSLEDAWLILRKIGSHLVEIPSLLVRFPFTTDYFSGLALIAFLLLVEIVDERRPVVQRLADAPGVLRWSLWYAGIFALLILGRWQAKEFIHET